MTSTLPISSSGNVFLAQAEPTKVSSEKDVAPTAPRSPVIDPKTKYPYLMKSIIRVGPFSNFQRNMKLLDQARFKAQDEAKKRAEAEAETDKAKQSIPFFQGDVNQGSNPHVDCSRGRK